MKPLRDFMESRVSTETSSFMKKKHVNNPLEDDKIKVLIHLI